MSKADYDIENSTAGCFKRPPQSLKRKHSEMENENKSIFTSLKEKLGFKPSANKPEVKKSILSPIRREIFNDSGEQNFSHGFSSFASTPLGANRSNTTNNHRFNIEDVPRKRVKFDDENLVTFHRQKAIRKHPSQQAIATAPVTQKEESLFTKFINFTANLF